MKNPIYYIALVKPKVCKIWLPISPAIIDARPNRLIARAKAALPEYIAERPMERIRDCSEWEVAAGAVNLMNHRGSDTA